MGKDMIEIREMLEEYYREHPEGPFMCVDVLADGAIRCYYEEIVFWDLEEVDDDECDEVDEPFEGLGFRFNKVKEEPNPNVFYRDDEPLCLEMKERVEEIIKKNPERKDTIIRECQKTNLALLKEKDTLRDGLGREEILSLLIAIANQGLEIGPESLDVPSLYKELNTYSRSLGRTYIPREIYYEKDEDEDDDDEDYDDDKLDFREDERYQLLIREYPWVEEMVVAAAYDDDDEMEQIMIDHYEEFEAILEQNEWFLELIRSSDDSDD